MSVYRNTAFKWILLFVTVGIVSFCLYYVLRTVFVIRTIEIAGQGITVVVDEKKIPKNLLFFPSEKIRSDILSGNQLLSDVVFRKKYPSTLVIQPVLRNPFLIIQTPELSGLVDTKGYVLEYGDQAKKLPVLHFSNMRIQKGEQLKNEKALFAIRVVESINAIEPVVSVQEKEGPGIEVVTEKMRILFSQEVDMAKAIATLQTLIAGFRIKGTLPSVVDLRFDKPVVHF